MELRSALRRSVAFGLAVTMVLSTAGCGKSNNTKASADSNAAADTTQKADSDKPYDGVTVK